jgi:uncharacterized membrane protein YphA (DoxX/SURF4 family)
MRASQTTAGHGKNRVTRHLTTAARLLMGLMFFVFGLNGFLNFIPQPKTPMPEGALAFVGALMKTGYMFPLIAGTQVLVGALLLLNRFVPLALALIAPVVVNIVAFHVFLEPKGTAIALVVLALELYLAWAYRDSYRPMLAMRARPCGTCCAADESQPDVSPDPLHQSSTS